MNDSGRKLTSSSLSIFFLPLLLFTRRVGGSGADTKCEIKASLGSNHGAKRCRRGATGYVVNNRCLGRLLSAGKHRLGYTLLVRHENWDNTGPGRRGGR